MTALQHTFQWIETYKYLVIFPIAVVEGPIITIICGFLVSISKLNFWITYALLVVGDVTGDIFYYSIGRTSRSKLSSFIMKEQRISQDKLVKIEKHFHQNPGATLLLAKSMHFLGGMTLVVAGASRTRFRIILYYSILGTMMKTMLLILIGYFFGSQYVKIGRYLSYYGAAIILLVASILLIYFLISKKISEKYLQ